MNKILTRFLSFIGKERNVYELAELFPQNRKEVSSYLDLLQDPISGVPLKISGDHLVGDATYPINNRVPNFTKNDVHSEEWKRLNGQFLNYHKSLSVYTLLNDMPIINYLALSSGIGLLKNIKVLDVGGGTGQSFGSFFQFPETIDYYLLDPNLRLLHDQFIRIFPKLSYLKMGHVLANAEFLPIKNDAFDLVINISAIDHLEDYKKFISEAYRVLKPGGTFFVTSHLDIPQTDQDKTKTSSKLFSFSFWERLSRYLYYRKYAVGKDDHTLHLENTDPLKEAMKEVGFAIEKEEVIKTQFYLVAKK